MRRSLPAFLIAAALTLNSQQTAWSIDPPAGAHVVLEAHGEGVQIYTCDGTKWILKAPDAKLLDAAGKVIGSHSAGPTWTLADGGRVQGELIASKPAPEADSIPWLLLRAKAGTPTGSLASIAFIRRTETHGGVAPASDCQSTGDAGKTTQVPYTATYTFYSQQ
jgi:hypothetical protein